MRFSPVFKLCVSLAIFALLVACHGSGGGGGDVVWGDTSGDSGTEDFGELPDDAECTPGETRCSTDGTGVDGCEGGYWVRTAECPHGCDGAACLNEGSTGICSAPIEIALDETVEGSTALGPRSIQTWSNTCTQDYGFSPTGPELTYSLELDAPTYVNIDLSAIDATYFGVYIRGTCDDPTTELDGVCEGSASVGGSVLVPALLPAGRNTIIVDDFATQGAGPGAFEMQVYQTSMPACHSQVPAIIDLSEGSATLTGDTATGNQAARWHQNACPWSQDTLGNEDIYIFTVTQTGTLRITAEALEPADSQIGLYMRTECEDRYSQIACEFADGNGANAVIEDSFPAGTYYIFVDDLASSLDETQTYNLTIEAL